MRLFPLPASAPYVLFVFATLNLLSACVDVVYFHASPKDMYDTTSLVHGIRATLCAAIVFLAGRFPVSPVLPGPNVAMAGDVSKCICIT
jgi:hypothetical protein